MIYACFLLSGDAIYAQRPVQLQGVIGVEGGELFSYDMTVRATGKPNEYKGVVKTYALKNKEVEAEVILVVNKREGSVELTETKILRNSGFESKVTICLVRAVLKYDAGYGVLKGPIITQTANNDAYCARGNITFTNRGGIETLMDATVAVAKEPIKDIPASVQPASPKPKKEPKIVYEKKAEPVTVQQKPVPVTIKKISEGQDELIEWYGNKVILEIWDNNNIDGDKVVIKYNDKVIKNLEIKRDPFVMELDIADTEINVIAITALNNGSDPPNTAMIRLIDGDREHKVLAHNDINKTALIKLKRARTQ